jgi:hypothetical protein
LLKFIQSWSTIKTGENKLEQIQQFLDQNKHINKINSIVHRLTTKLAKLYNISVENGIVNLISNHTQQLLTKSTKTYLEHDSL